MTHARLQATAFLLIDAITALRHGRPKAPIARRKIPTPCLFLSPPVLKQKIAQRNKFVWKCEGNWLICNVETDTGDVLCAGRRDALIIVDARARLAPTAEKWDDKRGNFLFLSRWCVIVWAPVRRGGASVWDFSLPIPSDKDFNSP